MHLVVSCGLKGTGVSQSLEKARNLTTKFVRNANLRSDLQSLTKLVLIHAPSNRWFYQIFEVERIVDLKNEVQIVAKNYGIDFAEDDFTNFEIFLESTLPLKQATIKFSATGSLFSEIIPEIDDIYSNLQSKHVESENPAENEFIKSLINQMYRVLNLGQMKKDPVLSAATFLDPRFKDMYFDESQVEAIKSYIRGYN